MIGLRVYGAGKVWFARVDRRRSGASWVAVAPEDGPEVQSTSADYAVLRAITAYERGKRRAFKCERCGHEWHVKKGRDTAPKKCPACDRPWRYKRRPGHVAKIVGALEAAGKIVVVSTPDGGKIPPEVADDGEGGERGGGSDPEVG